MNRRSAVWVLSDDLLHKDSGRTLATAQLRAFLSLFGSLFNVLSFGDLLALNRTTHLAVEPLG
jgi:hypothetical protein